MILQPGFLDHWKTRLLVGLADGDERIIFAVLRLWEFCQMRRKWRFNGEINDAALDSICHWKDARLFLTKSGFLDVGEGNVLIVHDFENENKALINSWVNGSKGGRKPTGSKRNNPRKPTGNPRGTHSSSLLLSNLILSDLSVPVRTKFETWVKQRMSHHRVKNWEVVFNEQIEMLKTYSEADQLEILSASIRGRWQGLFPPDRRRTQPNKAEEQQLTWK